MREITGSGLGHRKKGRAISGIIWQGNWMLKVDLARASDKELAGAVAAHCAALGTVTKVTIYTARAGASARSFAIVAMGTREAAEKVSSSFGGRTVGSAVVVFLEQLTDAVFPTVDGGMQGVADNVVTLGKARGERTF
jgi:hypothetical protein